MFAHNLFLLLFSFFFFFFFLNLIETDGLEGCKEASGAAHQQFASYPTVTEGSYIIIDTGSGRAKPVWPEQGRLIIIMIKRTHTRTHARTHAHTHTHTHTHTHSHYAQA